MVDGDTHLITEQRDNFGRSVGYVYSKNGTAQQTVTTGYGDDGRIASAGFLHGGSDKNFGYTYLAGTNMLQVLTKPNGMTLTQTYEATRDLLTGMAYHRGSTLVAQREYTYDVLSRPTARTTSRQGKIVNDTFAHNSRSELVEALIDGKDYEYAFDNMGNRQAELVDNVDIMYDTNALNQYTAITENDAAEFVPQFDADGNQTIIKTETGIWSAIYNAENRPVSFTKSDNSKVVECAYDSMGRRTYKKVTTNGTLTLYQRYIYRGYLQIACIDLTRSHHPALWYITWNPTQPVATRPLAIQKDGTWHTYGWDLTKNICELYSTGGSISSTYIYTPFGKVSASGVLLQPIQWSSEVWDEEMGLVYYNWRYYNSVDGRWTGRDKLQEQENILYNYCNNAALYKNDYLGASVIHRISATNEMIENNIDMIESMKDEITLEYSAFSLQGAWNSEVNTSLPECPDYYKIAIHGLSFDVRGIASLPTAILAKVHFLVYYETNSCHINFLSLRLMDTAYVSEGSPISFHIKGTPQSSSYIKGTCRCCAQSACVRYKVEISSKKKGPMIWIPNHIITTKSITKELQICAGQDPKEIISY